MVRLAIVLVLLLLVVFAGGALFLASSAGKALVLRTLSASLLSQLGVEARAAGLDYRPGSLGVTLHAVSIRQPAAARAFLNAERVEVDFSPAILSRNPRAPPARCHQARSSARLHNARCVRGRPRG